MIKCIKSEDLIWNRNNEIIYKNRLNFLDRRISSGIPSSRVEDWQPLLNYRNSLMHGETDQAPVTSKRAYTKRRKEQDANEEDDEENENSDADPDFRG